MIKHQHALAGRAQQRVPATHVAVLQARARVARTAARAAPGSGGGGGSGNGAGSAAAAAAPMAVPSQVPLVGLPGNTLEKIQVCAALRVPSLAHGHFAPGPQASGTQPVRFMQAGPPRLPTHP